VVVELQWGAAAFAVEEAEAVDVAVKLAVRTAVPVVEG
jgi:hypothetical protein